LPGNFPAIKPYITARFTPNGLPGKFQLGSGMQEQGSFFNRPLDTDIRYRVFLRAYTVIKVSE